VSLPSPFWSQTFPFQCRYAPWLLTVLQPHTFLQTFLFETCLVNPVLRCLAVHSPVPFFFSLFPSPFFLFSCFVTPLIRTLFFDPRLLGRVSDRAVFQACLSIFFPCALDVPSHFPPDPLLDGPSALFPLATVMPPLSLLRFISFVCSYSHSVVAGVFPLC